MANADAPFGLKPVRYISGAPYNGAANVYRVTSATSNLMVGDPVYDGGWGVNSDGVPIVDIATIDETTTANGTDIVGVVVGSQFCCWACCLHGSPRFPRVGCVPLADTPCLTAPVCTMSRGCRRFDTSRRRRSFSVLNFCLRRRTFRTVGRLRRLGPLHSHC